MPPPPIILIHRGDSFYLAHTIAQARSSNPESRLILLGDRSNSFYLGVEHHRYEDYFDEAREFAKLFTYEYFPNYQYPWILFCHQKYFALRDFVLAQGIDSFLLIDSDVMLYEPIEPFFRHYAGTRLTVSCPETGPVAHAAFAVVNDSAVISELCTLYTEMFSQSFDQLRETTGTDIFYEMVGLFLLLKKGRSGVLNTYFEGESFAINHSMLEDPRFEYADRLVRIDWDAGRPFAKERKAARKRHLPALHFHGRAKYVMRNYCRPAGFRWRAEHLLNRVHSAVRKYPVRMLNKLSGGRMFPGI
jgi:hypothetical protein